MSEAEWRVGWDTSRTTQHQTIQLLIRIDRKQSMGWLIALGEPIFNKPAKINKTEESTPCYDYVI